ncbi:MAG: peptide-methionine (R)-S-oxide reductase MsrB [Pyrinomonadaceae bacterium]
MRYKVIFSTLALFTLTSMTLMVGLFGCAPKASMNEQVAAAEPTPAKKADGSTRTVELTDGEFDGKEIAKSNEEWKKELTAEEYNVMREEGTERPYSGALTKNHKHGTYYCAACGLALFKSTAKFESGTGWPSFFQPIFKKNVVETVDNSLGEVRTEVECARCHAHLGHVFDDGPQPTGLRYCMNSVSLKFKAEK